MNYLELLLLLSILPVNVHSKVTLAIIVCTSKYPMVIYEKCLVDKVNKPLSTITLQQRLLLPLKSVYFNLSIVQFSKSLNRVLYTFNNVDVGNFLVKRRNSVIRLLFEYMKKFINVNHSCPFQDYILLRNFVVHNADLARVPVLKGEYGVMSSWKFNGIGFAESVSSGPVLQFCYQSEYSSPEQKIYFYLEDSHVLIRVLCKHETRFKSLPKCFYIYEHKEETASITFYSNLRSNEPTDHVFGYLCEPHKILAYDLGSMKVF